MKQSQKERILEALQAHKDGVHSFTLVRDMWILRAAARIKDLREDGYNIESIPEKMGNSYGVRYKLAE